MTLLLEDGRRVILVERLTFDRLFRLSDPKRVVRSGTVSGPPLDIDAYADTVYYTFNFKSNPSTTGLRHRGFIKFYKPANGQQPLQHVPCLVDCTCPDYRYRWAWANKQRQSGRVGNNSLNQALNRAPRRTNPSARPGLCKHILAMREYLYGLLTTVAGEGPDTADKIGKLVKYAQKRWTEFPDQMAAAKERERRLAAAKAARRAGAPIPTVIVPQPPVELAVEPVEPTNVMPPELPEPAALPAALAVPPANNLAVPPEQRMRPFPGSAQNRKVESVDILNGQPTNAMTELIEAQQIIKELLDDEVETPHEEQALIPVDDTMPAPSDASIGADTEGAAVIGLLSDIRDILVQLSTAETAEAGMEGEGGGEGEMPPIEDMAAEGEGESDADFPPPSADDIEGEDEDEDEDERLP